MFLPGLRKIEKQMPAGSEPHPAGVRTEQEAEARPEVPAGRPLCWFTSACAAGRDQNLQELSAQTLNPPGFPSLKPELCLNSSWRILGEFT